GGAGGAAGAGRKVGPGHRGKVVGSRGERKRGGAPGAPAGAAAGRGVNANVGKTAAMMSMSGGRGASFAAGPGFDRIGPPPFREPGNRDPEEALKVLLAAGANPNGKTPDGSTMLHQAVSVRRTDMIRTLVAAGAKLDEVNKDNQTPLIQIGRASCRERVESEEG